jgi:hypothetical protein
MPEWEELQLFDTGDEPAPKKGSRRQLYGQSIPDTVLHEVWAHYVSTFSHRGRQPRLTTDRVQLITMAVNEYGKQATLDAITGCSLSEWHMGGNPAGRRYTSIELILRDGAHIERFYGLTVAEDSKGGFLDD